MGIWRPGRWASKRDRNLTEGRPRAGVLRVPLAAQSGHVISWAAGLILSAGRDVLDDRQMREESFDFRRAPGFRVAFAVKEDELPDRANVRFFGTFGVMEEADFLPDAIEESGLGSVRGRGEELGLLRIGGRHRPPVVCDRVPAIASAELHELAASQSTRTMITRGGNAYHGDGSRS